MQLQVLNLTISAHSGLSDSCVTAEYYAHCLLFMMHSMMNTYIYAHLYLAMLHRRIYIHNIMTKIMCALKKRWSLHAWQLSLSSAEVLTLKAAYRVVRHMRTSGRSTTGKCAKHGFAALSSNVSAAL